MTEFGPVERSLGSTCGEGREELEHGLESAREVNIEGAEHRQELAWGSRPGKLACRSVYA